MNLVETIKARAIFELLAIRHNTTAAQVRADMQEAIDAAYATQDPAARAYWVHLFPKGKPTPEAFILRISAEIKNQY